MTLVHHDFWCRVSHCQNQFDKKQKGFYFSGLFCFWWLFYCSQTGSPVTTRINQEMPQTDHHAFLTTVLGLQDCAPTPQVRSAQDLTQCLWHGSPVFCKINKMGLPGLSLAFKLVSPAQWMDIISDLTTKTAKVLFRVHCVLELFRKARVSP